MKHKYLYGNANSERVMIHNTPDQIVAFIMKYKSTDTIITTPLDQPVLSTVNGGFILKCKDQAFLQEQILPLLIPVQMGNKRAPRFKPVLDF